MDIRVLIGIVVSVAIGVSIIPVASETMKTLDTSNMSSGMVSLINILPIIVVTMIIIGSVGYFVMVTGNREEEKFEENVSVPKDPTYFPVDKQEERFNDVSKMPPPVAPFPDVQLSETVSETKSSPKTSGAIKSFRK